MRGLVPLISAVAAILVSVVYCVLLPSVLPLERTFPLTRRVELDHLKARDRAMHARILQGVVDFSVEGSSDPYLGGYEWLPAVPAGCSDCPQSSGLGGLTGQVLECPGKILRVFLINQESSTATTKVFVGYEPQWYLKDPLASPVPLVEDFGLVDIDLALLYVVPPSPAPPVEGIRDNEIIDLTSDTESEID
ncbi:hypothetical protein CJ030_MR7G015273 [Morella rubra]|uniref:Uncharacterized protein n=2 Tax=Morella rubra TaxID=262757 RepID=A0A6A1UX45_9ROSI|nr:hypothetical protein CJ030_MR7G015273 [Morella rubra]